MTESQFLHGLSYGDIWARNCPKVEAVKAILDDYAEQQQQLTAASGSDDGMVGLHIGFDIPVLDQGGCLALYRLSCRVDTRPA